MITLRKLEHSDYDDIVDISKDLWDDTDYLPDIFHEWVDDDGLFIGAIDSDTNKVVGVDKYSILYDKSGWLEGLRVHKDYRGRGISKLLAEHTLKLAMSDLESNKTLRIGYATHISSKESIGLMNKYNFKLVQSYHMLSKEYTSITTLNINDFSYTSWQPSFEEFTNHIYFKKRDNLVPLTFVFQEPTKELYQKLNDEDCFVSINGFKGIYKFKGEPHFIALEDSFEAIKTFMDYYLLKCKAMSLPAPLTAAPSDDNNLLQALKKDDFISFSDWQSDYLYYCYEK